MDLIYCAGNNARLVDIAAEEGWLLGLRSDESIHRLPDFVDINYRKPDFEKHLEVVKQHRPKYATVPDLSEKEVSRQDVERALQQIEQIQPYCEIPLVVPKLSGQIALLPLDIAIGYSVPSSYGGAQFPVWELAGRRVHLLGGSPRKQWQAYLHLSAIATVTSADSNYAQKMAVKYGEYWEKDKWVEHPDVKRGMKDLYFDCWRWSCRNIRQRWCQIIGR